MIFYKLKNKPATENSHEVIEEITRKVVFNDEHLKKHPSIKNVILTYHEGHKIYYIHSFNDVEMEMQSIAHYSVKGQHWYWQSFDFGTIVHNGINKLVNPDFQKFLIDSKISEQEFRDFILDFQELNDNFIKEIGLKT